MNLSNNTNSTHNSIEIDTTIFIIEISLSIITVALNLLNIALISISTSKEKTFSNIIFLLNTITDFVVGLISVPGYAFQTFTQGNRKFNSMVCVIYKTFDYANSNFSLMLLLVITIHRWLQLKDPFKQKEEMNRWRWLLIFIILVFNYIIWFVIWYFYFEKGENANFCYPKFFQIYFFAFNCVSTIGTFILIIIMNAFIIREFIIKKSKKLVRHNKKEDNAIYCILAITANLIICWGLYIILWSIVKICEYCVPNNLYTMSYLLNFSFAATNPIILLVFNKNYRSILFSKFTVNFIRNKSNQTTSTIKSAKTENSHSSKL